MSLSAVGLPTNIIVIYLKTEMKKIYNWVRCLPVGASSNWAVMRKRSLNFKFAVLTTKVIGIGISLYSMAPKPKYKITKEMLKELHTEQKMQITDIADQLGCSYHLIRYYMKKFGIEKLPKYERIEGQQFRRLKVVRLSEVKHGNTSWECLCECGNTVYASTGQLKFGAVSSCGCLLKEQLTTHGMSNTRPYNIWKAMKTRCTNEAQPNYERYGGRGITYTPKWKNFENFWKDMGSSYSDSLTLERIDNSKGYSKENCRWATHLEQNKNMRSNIFIEYIGVKQCLTDLATVLGISRHRLYYFHKKGLRGDELIRQSTGDPTCINP